MTATGYQEPIGLLPQHDVLYLTSTAPSTYAGVLRGLFSAGRYPIHYRDETTNRPPLFSSYPTLGIPDGSGFHDNGSSGARTPVISGTLPPTWDCAHSPSVGTLAYLVTGLWYAMEQAQFAAVTNHLGKGSDAALRDGAKGLVKPVTDAWQTRAAAWHFRSLGQALAITPDTDTGLRNEFIASMQYNVDDLYNTYVGQANNPFGVIQSGSSSYDGTTALIPPWQDDFFTATTGYLIALNLPIPSGYQTKLANFFSWKAKGIVGRMSAAGGTGVNGFPYMNADVYAMRISSGSVLDYAGGTGPWYADWAAVYAAEPAVFPIIGGSNWLGSTDGTLYGEIMPGDRALWGNLHPAIAYSVQHGASGAAASYARLLSSGNYGALKTALNVSPVWSVKPKAVVPAWLAGKKTNEWLEISGVAGAGGASIDAYSGMAINQDSGEILVALAGGHGTGADNRVVGLSLLADTPAWTTRKAASGSTTPDAAYNADGTPASRHTYWSTHFIPQRNRLMVFGLFGSYPSAVTFDHVDGFGPDTNIWDAAGTWADTVAGWNAGWGNAVDGDGNVYSTLANKVAKWSAASGTHAVLNDFGGSLEISRSNCWDAGRGQIVSIGFSNGRDPDPTRTLNAWKISANGLSRTALTFTGSAATQFATNAPYGFGIEYDPDNDRILIYGGGLKYDGTASVSTTDIYVVTPTSGSTWDISLLPVTGVTPDASSINGLFNRFRYVAALKGFVYLCAGSTKKLYFLRTA